MIGEIGYLGKFMIGEVDDWEALSRRHLVVLRQQSEPADNRPLFSEWVVEVVNFMKSSLFRKFSLSSCCEIEVVEDLAYKFC